MKFAVLSDIHGNLPALHAVADDIDAWQPDQVIVNGDIVNRGPCSRAALQYVTERRQADGWQLLQGNHETFLLSLADPEIKMEEIEFEINRFAYWAYRQLGSELRLLQELPRRYEYFAPDGSEFRVVHASMHSDRDGLYKELSDEAITRRMAPPPDVFITSHTHQAFMREVAGSLVVNIGSAGAPFDFDWRPSYGRFSWRKESGWEAEIRRVPYDRDLIEADYVRSGFLDEGGPLAQLMLVELRRARGLIFRWADSYQQAVLEGAIGLEESVEKILLEEDVRPFLGPPGWVP